VKAAGDGLRAIGFDWNGRLLGIRSYAGNSLVAIDTATGSVASIGPTGIANLVALAGRTDVLSGASENEAALPTSVALYQNYPNPFNPVTTIRYDLPTRSHMTLTIFNALGQKVVTLVDGEQEAGHHMVHFEAENLSSGVYFCRLQAGTYAQTRKLLLMH
jgi:hypothetical protein